MTSRPRNTYEADRIAQAEQEAGAHEALRKLTGKRTDELSVDFSGVSELVDMLIAVTGRAMRIWNPNVGVGDRSIVVQRCRACSEEIHSSINDDWATTLAHYIRHHYDTHRCKPIDIVFHGCSALELTVMAEEAEAEIVRAADRANAIFAEIRRRGV